MRGLWRKRRAADGGGPSSSLLWAVTRSTLALRREPDDPAPVVAAATSAPGTPGSPDVVVRMLGPFGFAMGGAAVRRWTSLKGLTILKYLLINDGRARREDLMDLLWHGYRAQSARNNLNVAIYALRRSIEAAAGDTSPLVYSEGCYLLNPELDWWVDLEGFATAITEADRARARGDHGHATDAYLRAVGLYRGPLLEDETSGEWYLDERRVVQERYLAANEALAELYMGAGDIGGAVAVGEDVLRTDPCRESTHRLLMRCFARQHQGQLIARQFRRCTDSLERELGLRPAGETQRLYRELTHT